MKLHYLVEGDLADIAKLASRASGTGFRQIPNPKQTGTDQGSRASGFTFLPTGIPHKPRHRKFLGGRQFSITPPGI